MEKIAHYIGGKRVDTQSGRYADVFNPAQGVPVAQVALRLVPRIALVADGCSQGPATRSHGASEDVLSSPWDGQDFLSA